MPHLDVSVSASWGTAQSRGSLETGYLPHLTGPSPAGGVPLVRIWIQPQVEGHPPWGFPERRGFPTQLATRPESPVGRARLRSRPQAPRHTSPALRRSHCPVSMGDARWGLLGGPQGQSSFPPHARDSYFHRRSEGPARGSPAALCQVIKHFLGARACQCVRVCAGVWVCVSVHTCEGEWGGGCPRFPLWLSPGSRGPPPPGSIRPWLLPLSPATHPWPSALTRPSSLQAAGRLLERLLPLM